MTPQSRQTDPLTEESLARLRALFQENSEECADLGLGEESPRHRAPLAEADAASMMTSTLTTFTAPEPSSYDNQLSSLVEAVQADVKTLSQDRLQLVRQTHA